MAVVVILAVVVIVVEFAVSESVGRIVCYSYLCVVSN